MHTDSFKRTVAKFATRHIVWSAITSATIATVEHTVDIEEDSIQQDAVSLGATIVGFAVSNKLEPYSDRLVDRVADWRIARKLEKAGVEAAAM